MQSEHTSYVRLPNQHPNPQDGKVPSPEFQNDMSVSTVPEKVVRLVSWVLHYLYTFNSHTRL